MAIDRESEQAREAEAQPRSAQAVAPPAGAVAHVLQLQRSAGNAAVSRMIGGRGPQVARLIEGNPQEAVDSTGAATTVHATPSIADATNMTAPAPAGGRTLAQPMTVRVKRGLFNPLDQMDAPAETDLYETLQQSGGGAQVTELDGTIDAPQRVPVADNSLFIDPPGPTHDDVHQGGIGSCWDMATFMAIVHRDPNKIRQVMSPDGSGGASVTFQRRVVTPPAPGAPPVPTVSYSPEVVRVDNTLAFNRSQAAGAGPNDREVRIAADGRPYGHELFGARLRAAPQPRLRRWFAHVDGTKLKVFALEIYQMARWAPLLEKAGARFSERYGQYGHSGQIAAEGENRGARGYANLEGGFSAYTFSMFYGQEAERVAGGQADIFYTAWSPVARGGAALLQANQAAFDRLLLLSGQGAGGAAPAAGAQTQLMTAAGDDNARYIERLASALDAAMAVPAFQSLPSRTRERLERVKRRIRRWRSATPDPTPMPSPPPPNCKSVRESELISAAAAAADPANNRTLVRDDQPRTIRALLDMLLVVQNLGTDASSGTRSVYANHEYTILSINILDKTGAPMALHNVAPAQRPAMYDQVDVVNSRVTVRNPHHANVYDPNGAQAGNATGVFDVSLESFFRLFTSLTAATVRATAPPPRS